LVGWAVGNFGLFGVEAQPVKIPWLNIMGACFGLASLFVYFFISPTVSDDEADRTTTDEDHESIGDSRPAKSVSGINVSIQGEVLEPHSNAAMRFFWDKYTMLSAARARIH